MIDEFTRAYIECALWLSYDDEEKALCEDYDVADISPESLNRIREDCAAFWAEASGMITDAERAGTDFWLSRNRNGSGFFDGPYGEFCNTLQAMARVYGESNLLVGDDGKVYVYPI